MILDLLSSIGAPDNYQSRKLALIEVFLHRCFAMISVFAYAVSKRTRSIFARLGLLPRGSTSIVPPQDDIVYSWLIIAPPFGAGV